MSLLRVVAGVGEVEGARGVECLAGVAGEAAVQQDGAGVAAGAGLPDRERPVVGIAEVLDAAQLDGVVVAGAEVAGQVAVGAAPGDGDFLQRGPALGGVMVDSALDQLFEAAGRHGHGFIVAVPGAPPPDLILFRALSGDQRRSSGGGSWRVRSAGTWWSWDR